MRVGLGVKVGKEVGLLVGVLDTTNHERPNNHTKRMIAIGRITKHHLFGAILLISFVSGFKRKKDE